MSPHCLSAPNSIWGHPCPLVFLVWWLACQCMGIKTLPSVNDKVSRKGMAAFITAMFAKKCNFTKNHCKVPKCLLPTQQFCGLSSQCRTALNCFTRWWLARGWLATHGSWERGPPNPIASSPTLEDDMLEHSLNKFIFNSRLSSWVRNSYHRPPREGAPKPPLNVAHTPAGRRPRFQDLSRRKVNTYQI